MAAPEPLRLLPAFCANARIQPHAPLLRVDEFPQPPFGPDADLGINSQNRTKRSGYVWFYTELDRGTTFKIYLPRVDKPVEVIRRDKMPVRGH